MGTTAQLQTVRHTAPPEQGGQIVTAGFFDQAGFELLQRVAKAFSTSTLVPQAYQGNLSNCMIALNLARRLRADELMVMQNLYIVHGNPGWSSKFLIACVNTCGRFSALRYEWRGEANADNFGCRAWTIERETGERLNGVWVDWKMVKAEGWNKKSGSKWLTMPDQMFVYRAAAFWQRAYAPEISMGLQTAEELADVLDVDASGAVNVSQRPIPPSSGQVDPDTGEILPAKANALPALSDDEFDKSLPQWSSMVASGKKTPEALVAMLASKHTLSAEQLETVRGLRKAEPAADKAANTAAAGPMTDHADFLAGLGTDPTND